MPLEPAPDPLDIVAPDALERALTFDTGLGDVSGLDSGYGDGSAAGMLLSLGYGDPDTIGSYSQPLVARRRLPAPLTSARHSNSRQADYWTFSQEGGELVEVSIVGGSWEPVPHRVDLVSMSTGLRYPQLRPGMNSARFGQRSLVYPEPGNKVLIAAMPAAPVGDYRLIITTHGGTEYTAGGLRLTYTPGCKPLRTTMKPPSEVYTLVTPNHRDVKLPWPANWVGGVYYAIAKELQYLSGRPEWLLREDFSPSDNVLRLTSTYGAPQAGWVVLPDGVQLEYTAATEDELTLVPSLRAKTYPANATVVELLPRLIKPTRYKRGT